jgi:DNA-binding SARP family transcriptional activator
MAAGSLASTVVEYGILGPLQVSLDGVSVAVAGDRRRALLARLLVAHGPPSRSTS